MGHAIGGAEGSRAASAAGGHQKKRREIQERRMVFTPKTSSEKISADTKERMAQAEYRRYQAQEKPVYDSRGYASKGISFSYADALAKADFEKDLKAYEKGLQQRWQNAVVAKKRADQERRAFEIQSRTYEDPVPWLSIEELDVLRKKASNSGEGLLYTQLYNEKVLSHYANVFANTQMDGRDHSVLDEIKQLAIMDEGKEKKERKAAILQKMEELGMGDGLNELFYPHFAGDGSFHWKAFGDWLKASVGAGLTSFSKAVADTADVVLGNTLKGAGWENNPVSQWAQYENNNYAAWQYDKNLNAEKLGGKGWNFAGDAVEATSGAIPQAILAYMTAGISTEATAGNLANRAAYETGSALTKAGLTAEAMMKNPQYGLSFLQTLGSDYKEAKEMGAGDNIAAVGAVMTSLINAGIEIGPDGMSGIQGLPYKITDIPLLEKAKQLGEIICQEGGEEGLQRFDKELVAKYIYGSEDPILVPGEYARDIGIGMITGAALGGGKIAGQTLANGSIGIGSRSAWLNAGAYAQKGNLSVFDSLNKAGLSGSEALARMDPMGYGQRILEAQDHGASFDQALRYATADQAVEVMAEQGRLDVQLDDVRGDPRRGAQVLDEALKKAGIQMTPGELKWLGTVAAKTSVLQQDPGFSTKIALEMLQGKPIDEAASAASRGLWKRELDRALVSGDFEYRVHPGGDDGEQRGQQDQAEFAQMQEVLGENAPERLETFHQQEAIETDNVGAERAGEERFQDLLEKAKKGDIIEFDDELEDIVAGKSFEELEPLIEKLPNRAARKWYLAQNKLIPSQIDRSLDLEGQARQAFDFRNQNRTRTRDLMLDQEARKELDISDPNKTFEEKIAEKMSGKDMSRQEAIEDILRTATKTRKSVNEKLGVGG